VDFCYVLKQKIYEIIKNNNGKIQSAGI